MKLTVADILEHQDYLCDLRTNTEQSDSMLVIFVNTFEPDIKRSLELLNNAVDILRQQNEYIRRAMEENDF